MLSRVGILFLFAICASCIADGDPRAVVAGDHLESPSPTRTDWIDLDAMDRSVRPEDDFYRFVNGQWLEQTRIPKNLPWTSPYVENYFKIRDRLKKTIQTLATQRFETSSDEQRVGDFYRSYMDVVNVGNQDLDALVPIFRQVDAAESPEELARLFSDFNRRHFRLTASANRYSVPFTIHIRPDDRDASQMIAIIEPAGLGMSNPLSYVPNTASNVDVRAQYLAHIEKTLKLANTPDAMIKAEGILELETKLAQSRLSLTARMDHERTYNKLTRLELGQLIPALNWKVYLKSAGLHDQNAFLVPEPGYFVAVNEILDRTSMDIWKAYLRWQLLRIYSPYLSGEFARQDFSFFSQIEMGVQVQADREDRAIIAVEQAFPELLGRLYVAEYFSADEKQHVASMAEVIREQFRLSIQELKWMSAETKRAAIEKLLKIDIKIGFPDAWQNYDTIVIKPDDLVGNLMRINGETYQRNIDRVGRPIDRTTWQTPAYASSAYYYRRMNELAIPAGYLLPPWYDRNADPAMNFGGIGTVIAHEMGHAFDNQGSQYDGDGNLNDWWLKDDRHHFVQLTNRLIAQYGKYSPAQDKLVDGELTLSENIGDLTGLTIAYRAFRAESQTDASSLIYGFSADQRYFISFAMHWRALYSDALLSRILTSDGHAPQEFRANGPLANFPPFYEAFDVTAKDGMFLPKDQRVSIW